MKFILAIVGAFIALMLWDYHQRALTEARQQGHTDVWTMLCDRHHKVANVLLADTFDGTGEMLRCSDFEEEEK